MKSIILCEGGTDLTLIQYFMEKANNWRYDKQVKLFKLKQAKQLKNNENTLVIGATGGCSEIPKYFSDVLESNRYSSTPEETYTNIVIITDRDEVESFGEIKDKILEKLNLNGIEIEKDIENNSWIKYNCLDGKMDLINFKILLLVIPFEENGALETFLLNAISKNDDYDKEIINKGNRFVDEIDSEKRYLNRRRYV